METQQVGMALLADIAAALELKTESILGRYRGRYLSDARGLVVWALRVAYQRRLSLLDIGRMLGGRDHTTILNAERVGAQLLRTDPRYRALMAPIMARYHAELPPLAPSSVAAD